MKAREILIGLYLEKNKCWEDIYQAIANKEINLKEETINSVEFQEMCESERVLTILDENYPESIRRIYKPPFVLVLW